MPEEVGRPIIAGTTPLEFTNSLLNRRVTRSVRNPLDRCTIVSIYPRDIIEVKHTIEPGRFLIPAGTFEEPGILVVGSSSWFKDFDPDQALLEIPNSSIQIANSVINDYSNGMIGVTPEMGPGLFFVLGAATTIEIKAKYKTELERSKEKQIRWYQILVRLADSLWARSNGNPLVIFDDARLAARSLHYDDKPWLKDFQAIQRTPCRFCGNLRDPAYPICGQCKAIDPDHPLSKTVKFAV